MAKDLSGLFSPSSVTIIGVSRNPRKVGAIVLANIIDSGFRGAIFPVNPNAEKINSLSCYKDIASLPETVDLAVIAIPAVEALEVLTQAGEKGIKNAVIFSAGFKEAGEEGKELEDRLISIARKYSINVLGPNCLGFVNNLCPINVTFSEVSVQGGNLRFISQSGAIASSLFDWCKTNNLGFSQFITLGNKAVINENDVLEYFQNKRKAGPIGLYLESISKGSEFLKLTSGISKTDPIFILKPGKTEAGAKAMQSHTGAIAGEDAVLEAVLSQAGVIRCQTLEDFFDLSRSFSWEESPNGDNVAIISNAGGPAVISADAVKVEGLELAEFDTQTHQKLLKILPRAASLLNPVDVLGDALADRYSKACEIILANASVDALVVILTPQIMTQIGKTAESLGKLSEKYKKLIFCSFIGGSLVLEGERKLNELRIPSFRFPERAIWAIAKMRQFKKYQKRVLSNNPLKQPDIPNSESILQTLKKTIQDNQKALDNMEANEIISLSGISTPETAITRSCEEAKGFAKNFGYPLVLKLSSSNLLHKKAAGGVITNIFNDSELETAWNKIKRRGGDIQVQKEIDKGVEVIIGVKKDPNFGPVLLFGAGGSFAELIADRNLHLLPIDLAQARQLVEQSKVMKLLSETSGNPPYALEKLYKTIVLLGQLAIKFPDIQEIEINPAIVTSEEVWAVDCKVVIYENSVKVLYAEKDQFC